MFTSGMIHLAPHCGRATPRRAVRDSGGGPALYAVVTSAGFRLVPVATVSHATVTRLANVPMGVRVVYPPVPRDNQMPARGDNQMHYRLARAWLAAIVVGL